MKKWLLISGMASLIACGNANQQRDEQAPPVDSLAQSANTAIDSIRWAGIYKGVTPCPDCDGIETTLEINHEYRYTLKLVYLGAENREPVNAAGGFRMMPGTNTLVLDGLLNLPNQYSVGQNMLMQLDMMGQPITGMDASKYMLIKQQVQSVTIMKQ